MKSKKSFIRIVVIIIVLLAGWYLWKGGFSSFGIGTVSDSIVPTDMTTSETGIDGEVNEPTTVEPTGNIEITDDIYVELMVQAAYQSQKNPTTYVATMASLYDKYDITAEDFVAYGETLSKDPARAQIIAQKYAEELQKLMK